MQQRAVENNMLRKNVHFSSGELVELTESELLSFFSKTYSDETSGKTYFECLLIPSQCKFMTGSTDEALGRKRMVSHLTKHVQKLQGKQSSMLQFSPGSEQQEAAQLKKQRIRCESNEGSVDVNATLVDEFFTSYFNNAVTRLGGNAIGVSVDNGEQIFRFVFDLDKEAIFVDGILCPVSFKIGAGISYIYDLNWNFSQDSNLGNHSNDSLNCPEDIADIVGNMCCREFQEFLTANTFPSIRYEHNYCDFWIKTPKPYMYLETLKAVNIYNTWRAAESTINFGVNRILDFNKNVINDIPEVITKKMNETGVFVCNQLWFPTDSRLAKSLIVQEEERLSEESDYSEQKPNPTPISIMPELLTYAKTQSNLFHSGNKAIKMVPVHYPATKEISISQSSHSTIRITEDDKKEEKKKREIALAALAELKTEFRRHREQNVYLTENGTLQASTSEKAASSPDHSKDIASSRTCKICNQTFTARGSLRAHYRSHAGVKPFSCHICGSAFTRRHSLNYHLLCHSGDIKYTCPWCPKTFRHAGHFKDHIRMHQCEPFLCPVCGFKFSNRTTLRRHLKLSHNRETLTEVTADEETADAVRTLSNLRKPGNAIIEEESSMNSEDIQNAENSSNYHTNLSRTCNSSNESNDLIQEDNIDSVDYVAQNLIVGESLPQITNEILQGTLPSQHYETQEESRNGNENRDNFATESLIMSNATKPAENAATPVSQLLSKEPVRHSGMKSANILRRNGSKRRITKTTEGQCHIHPLKGCKLLPPQSQEDSKIQTINDGRLSPTQIETSSIPAAESQFVLPDELLEYFDSNSVNEPLNTPKTSFAGPMTARSFKSSEPSISVLEFTSHDLGHIDLSKCNLVLVSDDEKQEESSTKS